MTPITLVNRPTRELPGSLKQVDAALAAYRRTIELFPGTRLAAVAKQRIDQFKPDARAPAAGASLS